MRVFRLQAKGNPENGPWWTGVAYECDEIAARYGRQRPSDMMGAHHDIGFRFKRHHVCGFRDLDQLSRWFVSEYIREVIFTHSILECVEYEVSNVLVGRYQVAFALKHAILIRILDPQEVISCVKVTGLSTSEVLIMDRSDAAAL